MKKKQKTPYKIEFNSDEYQEIKNKLKNIAFAKYPSDKDEMIQILNTFKIEVVKNTKEKIEDFLFGQDKMIATFSMSELGNSIEILHTIDIFMDSLLKVGVDKDGSMENILVVVEEAHTVMPEANSLGVDGYEAKALLARISQLALQGRKYGIGLLIIAQRTALVSKSILTQCNTIITFRNFDTTSYEFLKNYIGESFVNQIPKLSKFQAIIFGKGLKSRYPLVVQIPIKKEKETHNN